MASRLLSQARRRRHIALMGSVLVLFAFCGGAGCVSSRVMDAESTRLFRESRYGEASEKLRESLKKQGEGSRDELLYLLDLGLALHSAGKFEDAIQVFLKADKMAEIKDYTSLATEGATLLVGDNLKEYKGEDFENVLISTYLAMDYALLGDYENALVEARRVNRKLYLMVTEGKRKYKQNAFARYLSATIYEAERNYNDAYVDYKFTRELEPSFPGLGKDLWRMSYLLRMRDEMDRWDREYGLSRADHEETLKSVTRSGQASQAEVIVLYENGISPSKHPNPAWHRLPKFFPRANPVTHAEVEVNGQVVATTSPLHDIEKTAIENLDEKYAGLIAKKMAGVIAKEVVADQVEKHTNSPLLGFMARVAFYASDQADLRSWNLLPKDLQVARFMISPGTITVKIRPVGDASRAMEKTIQVSPGKKVFVNARYMP